MHNLQDSSSDCLSKGYLKCTKTQTQVPQKWLYKINAMCGWKAARTSWTLLSPPIQDIHRWINSNQISKVHILFLLQVTSFPLAYKRNGTYWITSATGCSLYILDVWNKFMTFKMFMAWEASLPYTPQHRHMEHIQNAKCTVLISIMGLADGCDESGDSDEKLHPSLMITWSKGAGPLKVEPKFFLVLKCLSLLEHIWILYRPLFQDKHKQASLMY